MSWYDVFSKFYDKSLEPLYLDARKSAAEALDLSPGHVVLDLPCGTGQSFDTIAPALLPGGSLIGVDLSTGMLRLANERIEKNKWPHVHAIQGDVHTLDMAAIRAISPGAKIDRIQVFLGMSTFPRWEAAFAHLWGLLRPGGRMVIVDVYAETLGFQGHMVNLIARAEIRRRCWVPLEAVSEGFSRRDLPYKKEHGGQIYLATGIKPSEPSM